MLTFTPRERESPACLPARHHPSTRRLRWRHTLHDFIRTCLLESCKSFDVQARLQGKEPHPTTISFPVSPSYFQRKGGRSLLTSEGLTFNYNNSKLSFLPRTEWWKMMAPPNANAGITSFAAFWLLLWFCSKRIPQDCSAVRHQHERLRKETSCAASSFVRSVGSSAAVLSGENMPVQVRCPFRFGRRRRRSEQQLTG